MHLTGASSILMSKFVVYTRSQDNWLVKVCVILILHILRKEIRLAEVCVKIFSTTVTTFTKAQTSEQNQPIRIKVAGCI